MIRHNPRYEYHKRWRKRNRLKCNEYTRAWRERNREKVRAISRANYANNKHKVKARYLKRRQDSKYVERERERSRAFSPIYRERKTSKARVWREQLRQDILKAYGGKCSCCGEREPIFLTLDHIYNDGAKTRLALQGANGKPRGGVWQYADLRKKGFPKDRHRLLCWNCNCGRQRNGGVCPHKIRRKKEVGS